MRYFRIPATGVPEEVPKENVPDSRLDNLFDDAGDGTANPVSTVQVSYADGTHFRIERDDSGTPADLSTSATADDQGTNP